MEFRGSETTLSSVLREYPVRLQASKIVNQIKTSSAGVAAAFCFFLARGVICF